MMASQGTPVTDEERRRTAPESRLVSALRSVVPARLRPPVRAVATALHVRINAPHPSNLLMWHRGLDETVAQPLPAGLEWRPYHPDDDAAWVALLNLNGELGRWDERRLRSQNETLVPGTLQFIIDRERLVAGTGVYDRIANGTPGWEIGWVVRHPAYRGQGLGEQIVGSALRAALALPERPVFLRTDDHRLTAIRLYLELGFEPDVSAEPGSAERWREIRAGLDGRASGS